VLSASERLSLAKVVGVELWLLTASRESTEGLVAEVCGLENV
jgi:hypothetical protein